MSDCGSSAMWKEKEAVRLRRAETPKWDEYREEMKRMEAKAKAKALEHPNGREKAV